MLGYCKLARVFRKYLLEEMAIICCEYRHGFSAIVYPGSLTTVSEISEGLHPNAPYELKNMTTIELKLKRGGHEHRIETQAALHKPRLFVEDGEAMHLLASKQSHSTLEISAQGKETSASQAITT